MNLIFLGPENDGLAVVSKSLETLLLLLQSTAHLASKFVSSLMPDGLVLWMSFSKLHGVLVSLICSNIVGLFSNYPGSSVILQKSQVSLRLLLSWIPNKKLPKPLPLFLSFSLEDDACCYLSSWKLTFLIN